MDLVEESRANGLGADAVMLSAPPVFGLPGPGPMIMSSMRAAS